YGAELAREMVRVTGVRAGQRALDVGCGTGALTVMLAEVLGAGNVAAIDPSERFVAACRDRAPGADLRVGLGEGLPWSDAQVDAGADYADFDDLWYPFANGVGNLGRFHEALDEAGRKRFKHGAADRLGAPSGPFRLTARAWYARGTVPAG